MDVFVARKSFVTMVDGKRTIIHKDKTRVSADSELVERYPDYFRAADQGVRFDVEDARSAPAAPMKKAAAKKPAVEPQDD